MRRKKINKTITENILSNLGYIYLSEEKVGDAKKLKKLLNTHGNVYEYNRITSLKEGKQILKEGREICIIY